MEFTNRDIFVAMMGSAKPRSDLVPSDEFLVEAIRLLDTLGTELLLMVGAMTTASLIVFGLTLRSGPDNHNGVPDLVRVQLALWIWSAIPIIVGSVYNSDIVPVNTRTRLIAVFLFAFSLILPIALMVVTYKRIKDNREMLAFEKLQVHLVQSVVVGGLIFLYRLAFAVVEVLFEIKSGLLATVIVAFSGILILGFIQTGYRLLNLLASSRR